VPIARGGARRAVPGSIADARDDLAPARAGIGSEAVERFSEFTG
jgi:hypothetical protein